MEESAQDKFTDEIRVRFLGTGGPFPPDPDRSASAILVSVGGESLLFDTGRGVVMRAAQCGLSLASLARVFITHHHYDHIGDLGDVMLTSWLTGRKHTLNVYGPIGLTRIIQALVDEVYSLDIEFRSNLESKYSPWAPVAAHEVGAGLVYEGVGLRVFAELVDHGHGLGSAEFDTRWRCLGYRVETATSALAISGDAVPCDGLRRLAQDADTLILCCYLAKSEIVGEHHQKLAKFTLTCADRAGRFAQDAGVKELILTHIRTKSQNLLDEMLLDVRQDFEGPVSVGYDLGEFRVGRDKRTTSLGDC